MASKPILTTGIAVASAAAIVAATPALMFNPRPEVHVAAPAAMAPLKQLTVSDIQLLASTLNSAIFSGYGGIVTGDSDPAGDNCDADGAVCMSYFGGATYYLTDTLLFPNTTFDNHLFEQGLITGLAEIALENGAPPVLIDLILQPFRAPVILSEALLGANSPVTQFLTALWDGGIVGVINLLINGPETASTPDATLLSGTTTTEEGGTSAVGKFTAPDLTKMVSLSVTPLQKKVKDADTGVDTPTVGLTAGDTTEVQDPTSGGGTVEPADADTGVDTGVDTPTVGLTAGDTTEVQDPTNEAGTVETVKTEKPKFNAKKFNPLANLKGKSVLEEKKAASSEAPQADSTTGIKKFGGGLGRHHKNEGAGAGGAAADGAGSESGGGAAE